MLDDIFNPFFTTKDKGTGLRGCRLPTRSPRAWRVIAVRTKKAGGSSFCVNLPFSNPTEQSVPRTRRAGPPRALTSHGQALARPAAAHIADRMWLCDRRHHWLRRRDFVISLRARRPDDIKQIHEKFSDALRQAAGPARAAIFKASTATPVARAAGAGRRPRDADAAQRGLRVPQLKDHLANNWTECRA